MLPAFSSSGPTVSCSASRPPTLCLLQPAVRFGTDRPHDHRARLGAQRSRPRASAVLPPTDANPPPPPPPPGREDEFSDPNGDALEDKQGKSVATLDRDAERSFDTVLQELTAIQQDGPRNVAILGAGGTNAAVIRGALRAEKPELLTVVLPQSLHKQPKETQEQLLKVQNLIEMKKNDPLPLDVASQLCNSDILSRCTHFIAFAFHDSDVVLEAVRQAKELRIVVTVLYLD